MDFLEGLFSPHVPPLVGSTEVPKGTPRAVKAETKVVPLWLATHAVQCYRGSPELVRILQDKTHYDHGFQYGEMHIEYQDRRTKTVKQRWISFGLYNHVDVWEVCRHGRKYTASCHPCEVGA